MRGQHPFEDVATEVVRIIDWETLGIPKSHATASVFRSLAKKCVLDSSRDVQDLSMASLYLCVYGFVDRARRVGLALSVIPISGPVWYMHIHSCKTVPCCFLERAGSIDDALPLRESALCPVGQPYQFGPRALDGSMLKNIFNNPEYDRSLHTGHLLEDITTLCNMWVFGSTSQEWTKDRIAQMIDVNLAELYMAPRWQPWQ